MKHFLFVSHDANRAGAQLFLLNLMVYLKQQGHELSLLLLGSGVLEKDFAEVATVHHYSYEKPSKYARIFGADQSTNEQLFSELRMANIFLIYVNTIASAKVVAELKNALQIPVVSHIHELEFSIQLYSELEQRKQLFRLSDKIIACSNAVGENLIENHSVSFNQVTTVHSFIDNQTVNEKLDKLDITGTRTKLGLSAVDFVVTGCGNAEWRKGLDIFIQVANAVNQHSSDSKIRFVWIGVKHAGDLYDKTVYDLKKMGLHEDVILLEPTSQAVEIIGSSDVFLLPSREDPFPLVMLEAALATKPILGFDKTGGCGEFVEDDAGAVVPYLDVNQMAKKLLHWRKNPDEAKALGQTAKRKVLEIYSFDNSVKKIEALLNKMTP
jgi:glycosyltransferase involved in cell wall biosynthesis